MKKFVLPFFSLLLVITLALSSFSSVTAAGGGDPWVTPVSGDMDFTTTVVPIASLPGVIELANQKLGPAGLPEGETQFGGSGVRVTGFDAGKATVCFSLSAIEVNQGWGGKVGMWNGTKWVLLPTSIAPVANEASSTSACAGITGNGTYAFFKYIADKSLLPAKVSVSAFPQCSTFTYSTPLVVPSFWIRWPSPGHWSTGYLSLLTVGRTLFSDQIYEEGTVVTFELVGSDPADIFAMPLQTSGEIYDVYGPSQSGIYMYMIDYDQKVFTYSGHITPSLIYRITLPDCYVELNYPPTSPN